MPRALEREGRKSWKEPTDALYIVIPASSGGMTRLVFFSKESRARERPSSRMRIVLVVQMSTRSTFVCPFQLENVVAVAVVAGGSDEPLHSTSLSPGVWMARLDVSSSWLCSIPVGSLGSPFGVVFLSRDNHHSVASVSCFVIPLLLFFGLVTE